MSTNAKIKYIIIDDHPMVRQGMKYTIESSGCFELLKEFDSIRTALTEPMPTLPEVMILDLELKDGDALPAIPRLKSRFPGCGIIVYTHLDCTPKQLDAAGVNGYLRKTDAEDLVEAMQVIAGGKNYFKYNVEPVHIDVSDSRHLFIIKKFSTLTRRQLEIAELMRLQLNNRQIGERLFISAGTVDTHRKAIKEKLDVTDKAQLFEYLDYYFITLKKTCFPDGIPGPQQKR